MKCRFHWTFGLFILAYLATGFMVEIGVFFLMVVLHELVHTVVAKAYSLDVGEIVLYPFGGRAKIEDLIEEDPKKEFHIALSGPVANLMFATISLALISNEWLSADLGWFMVRANLLLAGFNLLPGLPLDGGRIVRAKLSKRVGFREGTHIACQGGKLVGLLIFITGIIGLYWYYVNVTFFLVGIFVVVAAFKEEREAAYVYFRYLTRKKQLIRSQGAVVCEELMAFETTTLKDITRLFRPKRYHIVKVIDNNWRMRGTLGEQDIIDALLKYGLDIKVSRLL